MPFGLMFVTNAFKLHEVCVCVSLFFIVLFKHGLSVQILFGLTVYIKSKEVINISGVNSCVI